MIIFMIQIMFEILVNRKSRLYFEVRFMLNLRYSVKGFIININSIKCCVFYRVSFLLINKSFTNRFDFDELALSSTQQYHI